MKKLVRPSTVDGKIVAPPSKSVAQRAIAMAALSNCCSKIMGVGCSSDVMAAIAVCQSLGANISVNDGNVEIAGGQLNPISELNCGESGLCARMFSAIASTTNSEVVLTGEGSLLKRPMTDIVEGLCLLGARCSSNQGYLPLQVCGPVVGGEITIDGSQSSQPLTGILIASPLAQTDTIVHVNNPTSIPYVGLTIDLMRQFGIVVENHDFKTFFIKSGQRYQSVNMNIEGDWSAAAFWLVAGATAGKIEVTNLNIKSLQSDIAILDILKGVGAVVDIKPTCVLVSRKNLQPFSFDATNCPDLFPPLVALASHCDGVSKILGINRLRYKESDRAVALKKEFAKMGITIDVDGDLMTIIGGTVKPACVDSHNDHRIAMACAIATLAGTGDVEIDSAEVVCKSYPHFFLDMDFL